MCDLKERSGSMACGVGDLGKPEGGLEKLKTSQGSGRAVLGAVGREQGREGYGERLQRRKGATALGPVLGAGCRVRSFVSVSYPEGGRGWPAAY